MWENDGFFSGNCCAFEYLVRRSGPGRTLKAIAFVPYAAVSFNRPLELIAHRSTARKRRSTKGRRRSAPSHRRSGQTDDDGRFYG